MIVQPSPIPQADAYFVDGLSNGVGGICGLDINKSMNTFSLNPTAVTGCLDSSIAVSS